jgi:hypothetical protein
MLYKARTLTALAARQDALLLQQTGRNEALSHYRTAFDKLSAGEPAVVRTRLSEMPSPGALATGDLDHGLIHRFRTRWKSGEEARSWAIEVLRGTTTIGVDGSQLVPSKEFAIPVGLVQVAWFVNPHDGRGLYVKDTMVEVLAGKDLIGEERGGRRDDRLFATEPVNQRRFVLEMYNVLEFLQGPRPGPPPLVFFDGSLIVSFASQMRSESRETYVRPVVKALSASTRNRVPLAGYIDTSYARDIVQAVDSLWPSPNGASIAPFVYDAFILQEMMGLFDRTATFVCARGDVLPAYFDDDSGVSFEDQVCFLYLKTGIHASPARVEFPRWVLEANLVDRIVDTIRAEVIVGAGFPYPLEAADAAAVLSTRDRMEFFKLFERFASEQGLHAGPTSKMASKRRRR